MLSPRFLLIVLLSVVVVPCRCGFAQVKAAVAASQPAALSGQVTSAEEGPMEGVLVTAKKVGATIAITVVSDEHGRYRFPANRLEPGRYALAIRAGGYDLKGPSAVVIGANKGAVADLKLRNTSDLAAQLTNAEWLESMPGKPEQKIYLRLCVTCHTLQLIVKSDHTVDEFIKIQQRMATYVNQSIPEKIQVRLADRLAVQQDRGEEALSRQIKDLTANGEFMSSVNRSKGDWQYPLKTFPRPTGRATRVIITEYDLPQPTRQPHDVTLDANGTVWYNSFGEQILGKLDPKTGKATEYTIPLLKPKSPTGTLGLRADDSGNLWMGMMYQGAAAKFDIKTQKFQTYSLPPEDNQDYTQINQTDPFHSKADGKVWVQDAGTYSLRQLDLKTGKFTVYQPFPAPSPNIYDIISDSQNNGYFTVFGADKIGRIDAKSGKIEMYKTPTPNSNPRRGSMGSQGRFWFGEYRGNRIGMFDTKTQQFKEWTPPTPWAQPYDVVEDKNGDVWSGSMLNDRVTRLDPRTGQMTDYLLPRSTNIRRVFVDNSTTPVTFWVGNNHGASVIKLEPLE